MSSTQHFSYLIVGAGVFGVSTAYHLIKKYPDASVTLVDRDAFDAADRVAASWDWNKVMRADYDDEIYCKLALEAQDIFESDPLWKPYFHKTGIYWISRSDYAQEVIDNYQKAGRKADLAAVPVAEARKLYGGLFDNADYTGVKEVLVNRTSGWVAAGDCLRAVTRKAIELGVKYITAEVSDLLMNPHGQCYGVKTRAGDNIKASHVLLCAGAFTASLLEVAAANSGNEKLRTDGRIVAGGITTGMSQLDPESYKRFKNMPVGIQWYATEGKTGPFIGSLPPTPDRELKWWGSQIFQNTREVLRGRYVSAPPPAKDYAQWDIADSLKQDITHASSVFFGQKGVGGSMKNHRICWDAFTTSSDFIISPHAGAKGLFIATCGSFHGYKFFPIFGKYVIQMMEGSLAPELSQKWAWDRQRPDGSLNPDWPRIEMKELLNSTPRAKL